MSLTRIFKNVTPLHDLNPSFREASQLASRCWFNIEILKAHRASNPEQLIHKA